jgi:hypothetical protein
VFLHEIDIINVCHYVQCRVLARSNTVYTGTFLLVQARARTDIARNFLCIKHQDPRISRKLSSMTSRYFNHNGGMRGGDGPYDIIDVLQIRLDNLERRVDETFKSMQQTLDALIKMSSRVPTTGAAPSGIAPSESAPPYHTARELPPPGATPNPPAPTPPAPTQETRESQENQQQKQLKPFNPTRAAT